MIELTPQKSENTTRRWDLYMKVQSGSEFLYNLNLLQFSLTNKYSVVKELLEDMDKLMPEFTEWYYRLFKEYMQKYDADIILNSAKEIKKFVNEYIDKKNINFDSFVDAKKTTKTSILFSAEEIRSIALASTCLKIYSPFCYDIELKVPDNIHYQIYNYFLRECIDLKVTDKIFQLIRARCFKSAVTDRFMWELIRMTVLETPETTVMSVFNFMMTNLIGLLNVEANPVHYFIKVSDDSIKWLMKEVYKEKIIYGEDLGGDIYGSILSKETFNIFCCNDLILKCSKAGMKILEDTRDLSYEDVIQIKSTLDSISLNPHMRLLTMPIISKVLEIPYKYLLSTSPSNIILIGILLYKIGDELIEKYPVLSEFLLCIPTNTNSQILKSSYKVRDIFSLVEDNTPIFGINSRKLKYELISPICGVLSSCKKDLTSIFGEIINKITYSDLEDDAINFYTSLYSNKLEPIFEKMRKRLDYYL